MSSQTLVYVASPGEFVINTEFYPQTTQFNRVRFRNLHFKKRHLIQGFQCPRGQGFVPKSNDPGTPLIAESASFCTPAYLLSPPPPFMYFLHIAENLKCVTAWSNKEMTMIQKDIIPSK